ncbi:MAG: leucyl aminopeptidase [Proteobacteria bacterium ST_bin12]|nr:MAG: leucyl aminopeptidase [Proteobacteria bacterium ST_bin12]
MEFSIKNGNPEKQRSDCAIVGVFEGNKLSDAAKELDKASDKAISTVLKNGDFEGKLNSCLVLHQLSGIEASRVMLVGLGKQDEFTEKQYRQAVRAAVKALPKGVAHASLFLAEIAIKKSNTHSKVAQLVEVVLDATYQVNAIKAKKADPVALTKVTIHVDKADNADAESAIKQGAAIAAGVTVAKDLGNLPPNICTPTYLGEQAKLMAKQYGFKVEVLERAEIEKLGMGSFLGVAQGSVEPPRLIVLQHLKGKKSQKPVVLVGKGITFDTGGISLKPGGDMDEMKYDMCGAASVLGTFKAIGEMDLAINVVAVIPTCENMPDAGAIKPGDILTSMAGLTIEVLNTDAEGRLILCDALTYAERFEPSAVVDIATLTGACVIALGHHPSAVFSNKDALAKELLEAGEAAHDRAWHMPLWEEFQSQLDSNFADMANIGGRAGGSITAACFLSRFAKKYDWAHLDIAGTAWKSGKEKGGTGRPVPLLSTFLIQRAG